MSRYIDADKLKETIKNSKYCIIGIDVEMDLIDQVMEDCKDFVDVDIDNAPTADVEEVKHAKWVQKVEKGGYIRTVCSACGTEQAISYGQNNNMYCDVCGAKMDLESLEENGRKFIDTCGFEGAKKRVKRLREDRKAGFNKLKAELEQTL